MHTYSLTVAGLHRELPICKVTDDLHIGAFICFVMPLLVCAAGAFAGHFLALSQGFDTVQTAVIGGVIGFMIGAVGVKLFDRSLSKEESSKPKIIEICY